MLRKPFDRIPVILTETVVVPVTFDLLDPMQVVYHGNYARFFEAARSALLDRIGFGYPEMSRAGYAFPIVEMNERFVSPARLGDKLFVRAGILSWDEKLHLAYDIKRDREGPLLTRAETVQMAVDIQSGTACWTLPDVLRSRIADLLQKTDC